MERGQEMTTNEEKMTESESVSLEAGHSRDTAEKTQALATLAQQTLTDTAEKNTLATWDSPSDPANPYNWPSHRKISVGLVVSGSQLITTMSATMVTPALDQILHDLGLDPSGGQIAFSVFFLGIGVAPFIVAPLAEMYGRKPVWLFGNLWYIIWNSLCPVGLSKGLMITGRFLAASGASVGVTLTTAVLADMFESKDRGKSVAIAGLLPYLGPALGPIIGGLSAQHLWWPWLFWILSIIDTAILVLGYFVVRETYAPVLLRRKAQALQSATNKPFSFHDFWQDFSQRIGPAILVPLRLITHRPITLILALGAAIGFGVYTLILSNYAALFIDRYHQSRTVASLHYIAVSVGLILTTQLGGRLMDHLWRRTCKARPDEEAAPEYRISYMVIGLVPAAAGVFWYAWAAENHAHWALVDVAMVIFTCAEFAFTQGIMAYQVDEFQGKRAASASAATRIWTYLLGFLFPIFAPELYTNLGYGWGGSLLGFLFLFVATAIVLILSFWGRRIRYIGKGDE